MIEGLVVSEMPMKSKPLGKWDVIEPVGKRVVIRKDENKRETKSGIVLPGNHEIPVLTGRVIAISKLIENDEDFPIRKLDKVLFDPREAVPVEFEADNRLFVVPLEHAASTSVPQAALSALLMRQRENIERPSRCGVFGEIGHGGHETERGGPIARVYGP